MNQSRVFIRFALRQQLFAVLCLLAILLLWAPLKALVGLSLQDERYTYILLVPIMSAAFIYLEKERIFGDSRYCPRVGVPLLFLGLFVFSLSRTRLSSFDNVTVAAGALVLLWIGAFTLCYGVGSFKKACFPFLFLFLVVPIPSMALDRAVSALQAGSAELSYILFRLAGVPVLRNGMVMSLPGIDIEVAPQCSGIRSTMALVMAGAMVSRVLLRTSWARISAILCIGPIGIFRNAVRIVGISLLGVYVDRSFLFGNLHRRGGLLFALVGFAVLIPLVWLLRRWERHVGDARSGVGKFASGR